MFHPEWSQRENVANGYAPQWAASAAAVLGLASLLSTIGWTKIRMIPPPVWTAARWAACLLMAWSSAGFVFDLLQAASVAGAHPLVPAADWAGAAERSVRLFGAVMLFLCLR
jgi:hypothetical protein